MPASVTITNQQKVSAGVTILDKDGQEFTTLPSTVGLTFVSSDPTIADFVVGPDGMNGDVTSGKVGTTTITASATFADTGQTITDTLAVAVQNSAPGSLNFRVGSPEEE